jgi:hypothetical protein
MNLVILFDSVQMFFRNFGLRHVYAALGLSIGLAAPNAGQKIIARFARPVEWLRSRLRPQVPERSMEAQFRGHLRSDVAVFGVPNEDFGEEVKAVVQPVDINQAGPDLQAE